MTPVDNDPREVIDEEEQATRVRRKRDMLQQELEIVAMEQQLDILRRQRNAGHTRYPADTSLPSTTPSYPRPLFLRIRSTWSALWYPK
jgi:hypothetical protein